MRKLIILFVGMLAIGSILLPSDIRAQEQITATPARINLPSATPLPTLEAEITATPTRTPTPVGQSLLEVKETAGDVNVRAEPDPNAERLGSIRAGLPYTITGRYYNWLQFQ